MLGCRIGGLLAGLFASIIGGILAQLSMKMN